METDELYTLLDSGVNPNIKKRQALVTYLKSSVEDLPVEDEARQRLAYEIAGMLSTNFARSLDSNDTVGDVLALAGELEVYDPRNRDKWSQFREMVSRL